MTDELTKTFFDTFGIEPREFKSCDVGTFCPYEGQLCDDTCPYYRTYKVDYPAISDRILLELFDILRKYYNLDFWTIDDSFVMDVRDKQASYTNIIYRTGGDFKNSILRSLNLIIKDKLISNDKIKHQVRTLFEEG